MSAGRGAKAARKMKRQTERKAVKAEKRIEEITLTEADIKPGAILGPGVLEAIRAGEYKIGRPLPNNTRPSLKERQRQGRHDRTRNRQLASANVGHA